MLKRKKCEHSHVTNIKAHGDYESGFCEDCRKTIFASPIYTGEWKSWEDWNENTRF